MVSYFGAGPDHGVPQDDPFFAYAEAKAAADAYLRASELAWTVLGPGRLTLEPADRQDRAGAGQRCGLARRCRARGRAPRWQTTRPSGGPSNSTTATSIADRWQAPAG